MLKIKVENIFRRKLKSLLIRLFNSLENNNNANFQTNGEVDFIDALLDRYKGQKINVLDIGANVGDYSETLIKFFKKYNIDYNLFLFEPFSSSFAQLQNKFKNNQKVILNNFGLSDIDKEANIYYDKEGSSLASLYERDLSQFNVSLNKKEVIKLRRLDGYLNELSIDKIHFAKVDIEGHELDAFKGFGKYLSADFINVMQFEYGGANVDSRTYLKDIYQLLGERSFEICKIKKGFIEKRSYNVNMENFFHANYLAISKPFLIVNV